jgi:DNA-binding response OmpR family regulator
MVASSIHHPPLILVLSQDDVLAELLCYNLRHSGFTASRIADRPDVVVIDAMDSVQLAELAAHYRETARVFALIPPALISGSRVPEFVSDIDDFLTKPLSIAALISRLRGLLGLALP